MLFLTKNCFRNQKGSAINEIAIILPTLFVFFGTMFEFSRIYYIQNSLEYGAKQAARIGSAVKESVDANYVSKSTISRTELEALVKSSVRIDGVIEEPEQFSITYLNSAGTVLTPVDNLPFDRSMNANAVDYIQVEVSYPGMSAGVNTPIPAVFNPGNLVGSLTLKGKATYKIEGRIEK